VSAQIIYLAGYFGWKRQQMNDRIIREYKGYITDWCHHDLAVELAAAALTIPAMRVRDVVSAAGNLWS
jgi:hypothetical protein